MSKKHRWNKRALKCWWLKNLGPLCSLSWEKDREYRRACRQIDAARWPDGIEGPSLDRVLVVATAEFQQQAASCDVQMAKRDRIFTACFVLLTVTLGAWKPLDLPGSSVVITAVLTLTNAMFLAIWSTTADRPGPVASREVLRAFRTSIDDRVLLEWLIASHQRAAAASRAQSKIWGRQVNVATVILLVAVVWTIYVVAAKAF